MNDLELWQSMKRGDRSAFEVIYRNHIQALYKYGKRLSRDTNVIEDCIHDLFLDIWKNRERLGDTDTIAPYLITALRRKVYKKNKKAKKTLLRDSPELFDREEDFIWPARDAEPDGVNHPSKLARLLKHLTPRQKEIIYLKFISGLDYEEIGQILDMKYQSVRNLVHRAIVKMRKEASIIFAIIWYILEYKGQSLGLWN